MTGVDEIKEPSWKGFHSVLLVIALLGVLIGLYKIKISKKKISFSLSEKKKNFIIGGIVLAFLIGFFILAKNISPEFLEKAGYTLPLPIFTFFIALVDGFNPCNLFVLTLLLGLLVSASHSKKIVYTIGYTFIFVVFVVYFIFMAAWLNIFKYIGFITPLRIAIALIALIAGLINCKELFFFKKGVSLTISEHSKGLLFRRMRKLREIISSGSMPALISSSVVLAAFASLVELPCTAGFPIIYTGIISGRYVGNSLFYYLYLLLYNVIYVIPLAVIIGIFGFTMQKKNISERQVQIIKFIGGLIMILLGLVLLINPGLIGIEVI